MALRTVRDGIGRAIAAGLGALAAIGLFAGKGRADAGFRAFVESLRPEALAAGVSAATLETWLVPVTPDRTLPDLLLPGQSRASGKQAEFTKTPLEYLHVGLMGSLEAQGRELAVRHAATLSAIEAELGVDRHVLLAIWGRETAYGQFRLSHDVIRVLATQAYLGRRKDMFRKELIAALKMVDDGVLDPKTMKASWAGALGMTQFMPTEFYELAVDMDKDGRKDIWTSVPDALASAANQLKAKGWTPGQPWGYEVRLSANGSCIQEGIANAKPARAWVSDGVTRLDGKPIDPRHLSATAFVLAPGGAYGPMFLVFDNFLVLKRYNFADLYAVFVGHLADRIAGGGNFLTRWTTPKMISTRDIEEIQERLKARGLPIEKVDGKAGMNTRTLIGRYQRESNLKVDCWPADGVLAHLRKAAWR
jgi:lytic murein transglycosylase